MRVLLVVYDNGSYIHVFPQGLAYIAAVLLKAGHELIVYNQDKFHYADSHLTAFLDQNKFGVVGVGIIAGYYQYRKLLRISDAINKSKNRPFYILGGRGPSPEPEFFLKKTLADTVVIGEGEETVVELVENIAGGGSLGDIKGIAFREGENVTVNKRRNLIKDIDSLPFPAYHLFPIHYYRLSRMPYMPKSDFLMPLLSSRRCPFQCTFCYRMDEGFRLRSNESIIDEIKFLKKEYGINFINFCDELLMTSADRAMSLCESFIKAKLEIKWNCNGRLNYAKPEVLNTLPYFFKRDKRLILMME